MMKLTHILASAAIISTLSACNGNLQTVDRIPIDYVNPYIGNISHLLVPTFPTIQLPNSMLRVYPEHADYTFELLKGLPLIVTNHREHSTFSFSPYQGEKLRPVIMYNYDNEHITPYSLDVGLNDSRMKAEYALSHQSAIHRITYEAGKLAYLTVSSRNGSIHVSENFIGGRQQLNDNTNVYVYIEAQEKPISVDILENGTIETSKDNAEDASACAAWRFVDGTTAVNLRYGISLINEEQAEENLHRELKDYNIKALAGTGRQIWNETSGRIQVEGGTGDDKTVFYSSFYRTFGRPICMSKGGRYFSAFDGKVHEDDGTPFYTDDQVWDTYRAVHPLRTLIDQQKEEDITASYLRMAEQMGNMWIPTFPEVTGDTRRMNSNHAVATVADALAKGLKVDTAKAYEVCRKGIEEKTLAPWSRVPAGWLDNFYCENSYIPTLRVGEPENDPNVHPFERRQPVAVTLGTSYDQWCLFRIAQALNKKEEAEYYLKCLYNYRNLYNKETAFFHPKDKEGQWIEPFDYRSLGGIGTREYYGENNGWVYRWDMPHNVTDLISLMGGNEQFIANLDRTFTEPLGRSKYAFYAKLPDHTGSVDRFSMANEPSLHVPYLYNYTGRPWKTQKRIRQMLKTWFRNDLMGIPGDEDGGGMTSFVVLSSLDFYPVTPGLPAHTVESPLFTDAKITLSNGAVFEIEARNASDDNKYIQSTTLNGKEWNKLWFSHDDLMSGGKLVLVIGNKPNKTWANGAEDVPPLLEIK